MPVLLHFPADPRRISLCLLAAAFVCAPAVRLLADGDGVPGGVAGIAAAEAQKRQRQTEAAQTLFTAGAKAYADQSYAEAMDYFKAAFETAPNVPAVASQRRIFFSRYESAAYRYALLLADEAKWAECEKTLADVVALAEAAGIPASEVDPALRKMLRDLRERDERYHFSTSPRHLRNVDLVETKLVIAKGYRELGDYDRAERTYHEVLNIDPHSTAARTGLEEVERWRMNYYDAAYDHTRAKQLAEIAAGWETPVPPPLSPGDAALNLDGVTAGGSVAIGRKLNEIVIPSLEFTDARLADVVDYLGQKAQELDASEADPAKRGVNLVIDVAGLAPGDNPAERGLTVKLANVPLGVAIKYVAQQVGMSYRVDNVAVRIVSPSAAGDGALTNRTWIVPPGFLSAGAAPAAAGGAVAAVDPFAEPAAGAGAGGGTALVRRVTAQQFLVDRGVQFGPGASATFVTATNTLLVRNTEEQLEVVENIVQSARDAGAKMVQIHVKMVSVEEADLRQLGVDWLLGPSNIGSSPRAFFAGGTDGNAVVPTNGSDFPFVIPGGGPVGTRPVTGGLRQSDFTTGQGIDDVINRDSPVASGGKIPGVFSVAGVFTDPQFQMVLRALAQAKSSDMLSDSHVVVLPGQIGKIEQVREFIYPTEYDPPEVPNSFGVFQIGNTIYVNPATPPEFPATPATPTAFETRKLGQLIEVEPTVAADNKTVSLNVLFDLSDFSGFINYGTPITNVGLPDSTGRPSMVTPNEILMPVFDAIKETTNVVVWDGQTVAIGGFHGQSIADVEDKIPYLGDLPVLGRAFRSSGTESVRRALTIFVTVRLIDPGGNPINAPVEEEVPELMTRRDPAPAASFAPGPPPVVPAK